MTTTARVCDRNDNMRRIFPKIPSRWAFLPVRSVYALRREMNGLLGYVLMACVEEQIEFLLSLWSDRFNADDILRVAMRSIVNGGHTLDVMDTESETARLLVVVAYNAVQAAQETRS